MSRLCGTLLFACLTLAVSNPIYAEKTLTIRVEGANPSSQKFADLGGEFKVRDRSLGINFDAWLENNLYLGSTSLGVIRGGGRASLGPIASEDVSVRGTAFGVNIGYRIRRFTPFVGMYRYNYDHDIHVELPVEFLNGLIKEISDSGTEVSQQGSGVDVLTKTVNTDYRMGVWIATNYGTYRVMVSDLESDDASEVSFEAYYTLSSKFSLLTGVFHWTGEANTNGLSLGLVKRF